jgi:AcrR family transcriptional regulator
VAAQTPPTRERRVLSTARLIRERGARATSIDDGLHHSGAPRGSVYHHFPGGREQLLREATELASDYIAGRLEASGDGDPIAVLDALIGEYRENLIRSDMRSGCPVVAVAIESREDDPGLQRLAGETFVRWQALMASSLASAGVRKPRAEQLAAFALSAIEGALVLSRAQRELGPIDAVRDQLGALLRAELDDPRAGRKQR